MKSIYPIFISTSAPATNCQISWESAAAAVEYLFMGDSGRDQRQNTEGNHDLANLSISRLNRKPQIEQRSGRYGHEQTVPI